ncbi:MAG: MFS transporter [Parvibaculaceae bacterium]
MTNSDTAKLNIRTLKAIPRSIWALGFVSLFMDISSEMIHALLPVYFITVLGTSMLTVGIIEGVAEATAAITKVFSGALSDWIGKRKILAVTGYGLAAITKLVFPLTSTIGWFIGARFVDRIGKGIRGAPRDALIADIAPPQLRGASFGLRQSLDTVGAFVGPLLAIVLMLLTSDNFKVVFWIAVIPAFIALTLIVFTVKEPNHLESAKPARFPLQRSEISKLSAAFWFVVVVATVFTLARFSEAFLILKAMNIGLPVATAPAVMVVMNIAYALAAYPAGILSEGKNGRNIVLVIGILLLILADIVLALGTTHWTVGLGVILWGLHMGFTQGVLATLVADTSPTTLRGTAFGIFNLVTGGALLIASLLAGGLWEALGPAATFLAGAGLAAISLLGMLIALRRQREPST